MKSFALLVIFVTLASSMRVKSSFQLQLEDKIKGLKKTGWGKVATGLMELQIQTQGPMNELVTAFQTLIKDLNFKLGSEKEEYRWAAAEHHELDKEINVRLRDAKVRFGVASAHLQNTLYPERARLEALIAADVKLIKQTENSMEKATAERKRAQELYEKNVVENDLTLQAVNECVALLAGLQSGTASFVQVTRAEKKIKKLVKQLSVSSKWGHLAKVLIELSQDFANKGAVQKVLDLFNQLGLNLHTSRADMNRANVQEIAVFEAFMEVSRDTIAKAQVRKAANQADLDVVNSTIEHQEGLKDRAEVDRDTAQTDLDEETARWAQVGAMYEEFITQLMKELDAVSQSIQVLSTAVISDDMLDRVDW